MNTDTRLSALIASVLELRALVDASLTRTIAEFADIKHRVERLEARARSSVDKCPLEEPYIPTDDEVHAVLEQKMALLTLIRELLVAQHKVTELRKRVQGLSS